MNIKIIVATHKQYQMPTDEIYLPIHVGAEGKEPIGYTGDNTGENISLKNPYYCELTGLYWAWKNLEADYIGLAHYRRHFKGEQRGKDKFASVLTHTEAEAILKKYKVIVPKKRRYYIESLYSHYGHTHYAEHLDMVLDIIKKKCPEYRKSCERVYQQKYGYMFNMMVMERKHLNLYCDWLFSILQELEPEVDMNALSDFQKRLYGRVSEILFNVWLDYQIESGALKKEEIKEISCMHMEKINWWKKGTSFLYAKVFGKRYEGSF